MTTERLDDQAQELSAHLKLDWLAAPFTRCAVDNAELIPASPAEIAALPGATAALPGPFNRCPLCGRLYWPGSHVKRTLARLTALSGRDPAAT